MIGARIRELRIERGMLQKELAEAVGLTRPSITNIEAGRQNVSGPVARCIAAALDVSLEELDH